MSAKNVLTQIVMVEVCVTVDGVGDKTVTSPHQRRTCTIAYILVTGSVPYVYPASSVRLPGYQQLAVRQGYSRSENRIDNFNKLLWFAVRSTREHVR